LTEGMISLSQPLPNCEFDVYAFGMMSLSTLMILNEPFPEADAYAELLEVHEMMGGEAANTSIALAKLGVGVKIRGNILGEDKEAAQVFHHLNKFGIHTSSIQQSEKVSTVKEVVISDRTTRTIFGTYVRLSEQCNWSEPQPEDIKKCKILCLDPFFGQSSVLAARYAKEHQKTVVTVDTPYDSEVARLADVLIISGEFRKSRYADVDKEELFRLYLLHTRAEVIFTSGSEPVTYGKQGETTRHVPAFQVESVDTAGAGDSFRSGMIYGLLERWTMEETIRFAAALAAIVCMRFPGVMNSPSLDEIMEFMNL
jgi:sugar/nucleoside kinase (ribokinase family)